MIADFDTLARLASTRKPRAVMAWLARNRVHYFVDTKGRPATTLAALDASLLGDSYYHLPKKRAEPGPAQPNETWAEHMLREYAHIELLTIEQLRALPTDAEDFDAGVYFLWLKDELQYIGKSRQVATRVANHNQAFDRYTYIQLGGRDRMSDRQEIDALLVCHERPYIAKYQPPFNYIGKNPGT